MTITNRRPLTTFEKSLMRAMGLHSAEELDELLAQPISEDAALHNEPPDEEHDLAERMHEEADRQWDAQQRFEALSKSKYLN